MKTFLRTLAFWLVLALLIGLLLPDAKQFMGFWQDSVTSSLIGADEAARLSPVQTAYAWLLVPALAAWLMVLAAAALPERRWVRIGFWLVAVAGWSAAVIIAGARGENGAAAERVMLMLSFALALGMASWRGWVVWASLRRRVFKEIAIALAILVTALGIYAWQFEARTRSMLVEAKARWATMGMPMEEFDRTHPVGHENAGTAVARKVFEDVVGCDLYRPGSGGRMGVTARGAQASNMAAAVCDIYRGTAGADEVAFPEGGKAALAPLVPQLDIAYREMLAAEVPGWDGDPADGFGIKAPNFLGARVFTQIVVADSLRRIAAGDVEGAQHANATIRRLSEGLRKSPPLVSLMISVALDGLLAHSEAHLPVQGDGFADIAKDTEELRVRFLEVNQCESWICLRAMDHPPQEPVMKWNCLPHWAVRIVEPFVRRRLFCLAVLCGAEHTVIVKSPETLRLPDLGWSQHEAVEKDYEDRGWWAFEPTRAHMRIVATLLLREQVEMIREARARLVRGDTPLSRDSVVLPGVRWEVRADTEKKSATVRMAGAPEWITKGTVTPKEFWLLPLDGSVPWKFGPGSGDGAGAAEMVVERRRRH